MTDQLSSPPDIVHSALLGNLPASTPSRPCEAMAALGIRQLGDRVLSTPTRRFDLPDERRELLRIVAMLEATARQVEKYHKFTTGAMGLAAPQIGISRAVALYRPVRGTQITLVNPKVEHAAPSEGAAEDSEGCLSFFDLRGWVPRPGRVLISFEDVDGSRSAVEFCGRAARDVLHEVDHLYGIVYLDRMRPDSQLSTFARRFYDPY